MIIDNLSGSNKYWKLHPLFETAFQYLTKQDLVSLKTGRYSIKGEDIFAIIAHESSETPADGLLEIHRKYIDIQFTFDNSFDIGWKPVSDCRTADTPYNEEKDKQLFKDIPDFVFALNKGNFAVMFPEDAHCALAPKDYVKKVIIKVKV
ncbi:MAG: YhcH/YjgK/YiaL family protein [Bacteroidota bacterium]|jgi:YhcH/YjgK/YiaL family protein